MFRAVIGKRPCLVESAGENFPVRQDTRIEIGRSRGMRRKSVVDPLDGFAYSNRFCPRVEGKINNGDSDGPGFGLGISAIHGRRGDC